MNDVNETLVVKNIFKYILYRLTEYSVLTDSFNQTIALNEELKTAPQFTLFLKYANCMEAELEQVLNFLAFFDNKKHNKNGIYYVKIHDEYTVFTKTEHIAHLIENVCRNVIHSDDVLFKRVYQVVCNPNITINAKGIPEVFQDIEKIFTNLQDITRIKCLQEKESYEMRNKSRIFAKIKFERECKMMDEQEEKSRIENEIIDKVRKDLELEAEYSAKQKAEKKYREEKQKGANAKNAPTNRIKAVIREMFFARKAITPDKKTSEIVISIAAELNNSITEQSKKGANINDILSKFASKYQITDVNFVKNTIDYINKNHDGGQIEAWCYKFAKE